MSFDHSMLTVEGVGRASTMPDLARLRVCISSQGRKASEVRRSCSQQAEAALKRLENAGVPRKDMRTEFYDIEQIRDTGKRDMPIVGCRATTSVAVTLHKPEELGRVIEDALQDIGSEIEWSAYFDLSNESEIKAAALGEAVSDARRKAEKMATAAGVDIRRVISINTAGIDEVLRSRSQWAPPAPSYSRRGSPLVCASPAIISEESGEVRGSVQMGLREYEGRVTMEFEIGQSDAGDVRVPPDIGEGAPST